MYYLLNIFIVYLTIVFPCVEDHSHVTSPSEKVVDFEWYARTRIRKDKKDHRVMDLIVGLTLLGSILFLGCGTGCTLLCLLCLQRRRRQSRPQDQQAVARPPGLNRQEIELFPLTIYVATAGDASEDNVEEESACVICHDSYSPGQSMRTLTCSHSYHSECIDKWLSIHRTCPECRHEYP